MKPKPFESKRTSRFLFVSFLLLLLLFLPLADGSHVYGRVSTLCYFHNIVSTQTADINVRTQEVPLQWRNQSWQSLEEGYCQWRNQSWQGLEEGCRKARLKSVADFPTPLRIEVAWLWRTGSSALHHCTSPPYVTGPASASAANVPTSCCKAPAKINLFLVFFMPDHSDENRPCGSVLRLDQGGPQRPTMTSLGRTVTGRLRRLLSRSRLVRIVSLFPHLHTPFPPSPRH